MNFLEIFYIKTLKYDLINKFSYSTIKKLPKIKKIVLNFGCKTTEINYISKSLLALELITNQKGIVTINKRPNMLLKLRKGNPTGCKVTLNKFKMFNFFTMTLTNVFPKIKNFNGFTLEQTIKKNTFSYEIQNTSVFTELEKHYFLFNNLSKLDIAIIASSTNKKEFIFFLKSMKFPFK
jgi:large subunit ribosomal protein L5